LKTEIQDKYRIKLEFLLGQTFFDGNRVERFCNGDQIFPAMLQSINAAQSHIFFYTFIYWRGDIAQTFAHALAKKAQQGLTVLVLLDSFGTKEMDDELIEIMTRSGVTVDKIRPYRPWYSPRLWNFDNRGHRKILVVDSNVGFTGGVGIAQQWQGNAETPRQWRDTHFKITGPAMRGLCAAFMDNWYEAKQKIEYFAPTQLPEQLPGSSPVMCIRSAASVVHADISILFLALIQSAEKYIRICTAYFVPNKEIIDELKRAKERGVAIEILAPGKHIDKKISRFAGKYFFSSLVDLDIRTWEYHKTLLHTKTIVIDDILCCFGSANFNQRSMLKDDEFCHVTMDTVLAEKLNADFDNDLKSARRVTRESLNNRPLYRRIISRFFQPIKAQT